MKQYHKYNSKTKTNEQHPSPKQPSSHKLQPQTHLCLDTGDETPSTDNITFDSDSSVAYLDTCATDSMTPFYDDFMPGTFVSIENLPNVKGSGGKLKIKGVGTVRYVVHDDNDQPYVMEIPDTVYIWDLDFRLLAPQYIKNCERLAGNINEPDQQQTGMAIDEFFSTLYFDGGRRSVRINHVLSARVHALPINRGTINFTAFCTQIKNIYSSPQHNSYAFPTVTSDADTAEEFPTLISSEGIEVQHK